MSRSVRSRRAVPRPRSAPARSGDLARQKAGRTLLDQAKAARPRSAGLRFLARLTGARDPGRAWRTGAAGEQAVGRKLNRLRWTGWKVLHNIPLPGGGDVDHLLIGRAGVFVVNTKHHPRAAVRVTQTAVLVRGNDFDYPAKSQREASRTARVLAAAGHTVEVRPLIVVHGHTGPVRGWIRHAPMGVAVVPSNRVLAWLRLPRRRTLDRAQVRAVYAAARQTTTWSR